MTRSPRRLRVLMAATALAAGQALSLVAGATPRPGSRRIGLLH